MIVRMIRGMTVVMAIMATPRANATATRRQKGRSRLTMRRRVPRASPSGGGSREM
jgi:hypothetical protein